MAGAEVSVVVLGGRAALVIDVPGEGHTGPLTATDDPVVWSFTERGLKLLPAFLGQALPESDLLKVAAGHGQLALATPEHVDVVELDLDALPDGWFDAADAHEGVLLFVGRDLGVSGAEDEQTIGKALDTAAVDARLLGAVVPFD